MNSSVQQGGYCIMRRLMLFLCILFVSVWGSQRLSPVLAEESGQGSQVAPAAEQPGRDELIAPRAAPSSEVSAATEERAPMQKIGHSCASFGKKTGRFFGTTGKKTGCFFRDAGVKTGRFFKNLFVK
ncbi:MAG: hypothetical protein P8123_06505 [bacterium]